MSRSSLGIITVLMSAMLLFAYGTEVCRAEVIVGVVGPMTGPNAQFGQEFAKGAEQAASDINIAGGLGGERIVIEIEDDVADPMQGLSIANKFVDRSVKFVVGHFNSRVSIPASEIYAENNVLEISPSSVDPVYTERGLWNTFRLVRRGDRPESWLTELRDSTEFSGARGLVSNLRQSGFESSGYTAYAYAAVQLIAAGIRRVGKDPRAVAEALKDGSNYSTVLGDVAFDDKGDVLDKDMFDGESVRECPACPSSGACPQYVKSAVAQCCKKSGACPQSSMGLVDLYCIQDNNCN